MIKHQSPPSGRRIPLWLKLAYTAFVCVFVPCYWQTYGPTNFLFLCDVALFIGLAAIWLESPLLASAPAVGILIPQLVWIIDFTAELVGLRVTGLTGYMFKADIPLHTRALSLFHGWLPVLLVWMVWRLGYHRRAWMLWTAIAWVILTICYLFFPPPPAPPEAPHKPVNVNYVYGFSQQQPQTWMPQWLYFAAMLAGVPLVVVLPAHVVLSRILPEPHSSAVASATDAMES